MDELPLTLVKARSLYGNVPQTIRFSGLDEDNSVEVISNDVTVVPSSGEHESGSSKVKLKNIVDFNWEVKFYTGQLLAVHVGGKYVAYGISVQKGNGVVRLVNRVNNERSLLKGMQGMVQDIAFAHIPHEVVLACVDEFGSLLVHSVQESDNKMICTLLLHVQHHNEEVPTGMCHRVIWCPYIPDEEEGASTDSPYDDVAKLLVLVRGCKAELWNVGVVMARYGNGPLYPEDVEEGFLQVKEHNLSIVDAAFSPDGVALATASLDGDVKFFQVYMHTGEKPRCLHQWQPHGGKPVSALFFLDNHKNYNPEVQFWKYAITGADNNTEIKLWSCESWTCLQTICFTPENTKKKIVLKAGLDLGAGYLLLSDIHNKLLYILQLFKNSGESCAFVRTISEFSLPYPILSFGIVDAGLRTVRSSSFEILCSEDREEDPIPSVQAVVVRMYLVQPKSLQECHIAYQPPPSTVESDLEKIVTLSNDSLMFKDGFSDLSQSLLEKSDLDSSLQDVPANHNSQLNLMTPDAFSSPARKESPGEVPSPRVSLHKDDSPLVALEAPLAASPTLRSTIAPTHDEASELTSHTPADSQPLATSESVEVPPPREAFASGGSSPSREVQQILFLKAEPEFIPDNIDVIDQVVALPAKTSPPKDEFGALPKEKIDGGGWPEIPLALVSDVCKSVAAVDDNPGKRSSTREAEDADTRTVHLMKQALTPLETMVSDNQRQLEIRLENTERQLQELRAEMKHLSQRVSATATSEIVESTSSQLQTAIGAQLTEWAETQSTKEQNRHEASMNNISHMLSTLMKNRLSEVIQNEFQNKITPAVMSSMDPLKRQIHMDITQRLASSDNNLKENLAKLIVSKPVLESYSSSVLGVLQPLIKSTFKDVFSSIILPSFEKAFHGMFQQINDIFCKGTKEYMQTVDKHNDRRQQEKGRDILNQLQCLTDAWRASSDSLALQLSQEVQRQVQTQLTSIQNSVNQTIGEAVKEHISKGFHAQKSVIEDSVITAVRSRAVTPAPHVLDAQLQQTQVLQLIAQGQINAAFQQALSASDLNLVVFVCEKVNPAQVFNQTPCPLQQHVLLSLIQQLSSDMANHTELKHKYLEEAVVNLDPTNMMTREHLPTVISNLQRQLVAYMKNNPNNKITRNMRMLHMATQSLLSS